MAESEQNGGRATQDWRLRACCPSEALLLLKFVSKVSKVVISKAKTNMQSIQIARKTNIRCIFLLGVKNLK